MSDQYEDYDVCDEVPEDATVLTDIDPKYNTFTEDGNLVTVADVVDEDGNEFEKEIEWGER